MPIISVVIAEGRSCEQKRDFCRRLTDAAVSALLVRPDQVLLVLVVHAVGWVAGSVTLGRPALPSASAVLVGLVVLAVACNVCAANYRRFGGNCGRCKVAVPADEVEIVSWLNEEKEEA